MLFRLQTVVACISVSQFRRNAQEVEHRARKSTQLCFVRSFNFELAAVFPISLPVPNPVP